MNRKVSLGAAVSLVALAAAVAVSLTYVYAMGKFNEKLSSVNARQAMYTKLAEVDRNIRQDYDGEWDETALLDSACRGYLAGLQDPNSEYLSAEAYKAELDAEAEPESGIGIHTIQNEDSNMEILRVEAASSGKKAGLRKGDVIFKLDGKAVAAIGYGTAVQSLKGKEGSAVELSVLRTGEDGETERLTISVSHEKQETSAVESERLGKQVGYLAIRSFDASTPQSLEKAYHALKEEGVSALILDLRNLSGNDMEAMVQAADLIAPEGDLLAYRQQDGTVQTEYTSDPTAWEMPLAVLINQGTEGAAELFAADLRSLCGSVLVGEKSAGSTAAVKTVMLSDGSAIRFTAGEYLTPEKDLISGSGVAPDMTAALGKEAQNQLLRGELSREEDIQLHAAVMTLSAQGVDCADIPFI